MAFKLFLLSMLALLLGGCLDKSLPPGVVARVNGENIHLHSLQTLIDSRTGSLGLAPGPAIEEMQKNYARALGILVSHALVRQELKQAGMGVSQKDYENLIDEIRKDLGAESLDETLGASFIRREDWEALVRDYLSMEVFRNRILKPGIKIGLNEIRTYYDEHKNDFQTPAAAELCFITAENEEDLTEWCKADRQKDGTILSQCLEIADREMPDGWRDLKTLPVGKCAPGREENGEWQTVLIRKRLPARKLALSEVYSLIESLLLAERQNENFEKWLSEKVRRSSIQVAPALNEALRALSGEENIDPVPETGRRLSGSAAE